MRVERTVTIRAPRERVWTHLEDPARHSRFMHDATRWERRGSRRKGIGARYSVRLRIGAAHAGGEIEIVEYEPGWELAWTGVTGLEHRGRWRLRDAPGGGTRVTFRITYSSPGGMWGMAVDAASAPMLAGVMERSLQELKRQVEAETPAQIVRATDPLSTVLRGWDAVRILHGAGMLEMPAPGAALGLVGVLGRWGMSPAAGPAAAAIQYPDEIAIIDDAGRLTFRDVERRSNAIARGLADLGVEASSAVGILCRNHRGFVETTIALWKLGATAVYLNTSFAGPQLADVVAREGIVALVHDAEFTDLLAPAGDIPRVIAWEEGIAGSDPTLEDLAASFDGSDIRPPRQPGRSIVLTSGTTGSPKGAHRPNPTTIEPALALLSKIPLRRRETTLIAAPLFHVWGFGNYGLSLALSSTLVLQRRFDPEATLDAIERHRPSAMIAVPVMLQRILELPPRTRRRYDTSSLRVVAVSGSSLPGELAARFMDEFGDVIHNVYGSTEVAWATIATPDDLRSAPGTAGRPPRGTLVRVHLENGDEALPGEVGRIFVGNEMLFEGYTGGGGKESIDGLMATGDSGHFDDEGMLFVDGRADDMIVSGGENVYPREVEDLLAAHPAVADVAVVGVPDPDFGQALAAFVVKKPRARLTADQVRAHVRSNLARYKVPRKVTFVKELPRNAAGKILKNRLAS